MNQLEISDDRNAAAFADENAKCDGWCVNVEEIFKFHG